jgi:hypothetical protein
MNGEDLDEPSVRGKQRLTIAVTILVVAGIAVAVPLAVSSRHGHSAQPAAVPSTIHRGGTALRYAGDESWSDPVLDEARSNTVYVWAGQSGGTAKWGSFCQSTPIARVVSQTRATVTVAVATYAQPLPKPKPGEGVGCPAVGLGAARLTITLAQPLGTRCLVDAYDGAARQVLDPATVLKPTYLPDGYTGGQATWATQPPGTAVREYQGPGASLTVTVGSAALNRHDEHIIELTTVRGHPATVSNSTGFEQDILVAWSKDATHAVTVYQTSYYEKAHPPLTTDQLVRIANSLRAPAPPPASASASPGEPVPSLVQSKTHQALTTNTVLQLDQRVQWVKTTTHKWAAVEYGPNASAPPADVDIYVVQIQGSFVCPACKSPRTVTGTVMILELPLQPNQQIGEGFSMGNTSYDLSRLGTVHVFKGS